MAHSLRCSDCVVAEKTAVVAVQKRRMLPEVRLHLTIYRIADVWT